MSVKVNPRNIEMSSWSGVQYSFRGASMEHGSRRFRGIIGVGVTWGIALSLLATGALALGLATGLVPSSIFGARELVAVAVRGFLAGGVAGGFFAWLLASRERGHALSTLSTRRVALWGFLGAASIPAIVVLVAAGPVLPLGVLVAGMAGFGCIGSVLGAATIQIARRGMARLGGVADAPGRLMP